MNHMLMQNTSDESLWRGTKPRTQRGADEFHCSTLLVLVSCKHVCSFMRMAIVIIFIDFLCRSEAREVAKLDRRLGGHAEPDAALQNRYRRKYAEIAGAAEVSP